MRSPVTNPFQPGSDVVPDVWAGRVEQLSDWRDAVRPRRRAGLYETGRTILGEPGTGKSSLVRKIARDAADAGDWVTPQLRIPSGADPLKIVASAVLRLADKAGLRTSTRQRVMDLLSRVEQVAISGFSLAMGGGEGPEPFTALFDLLIELGQAAIDQDAVILIHIDEVQNITDEAALSQLLIALGDALSYEVEVSAPGGLYVTRFLPIAVYLTGLPDFEDMAGARKGATFARRFRTTTLTALDEDDLLEALQPFILEGWETQDDEHGIARVSMSQEAAKAIVALCCGEPFLFQLAGQRAWNAAQTSVISEDQVVTGWSGAEGEASAHVERILNRLPTREHEFIDAMAALPPADRKLTKIAEQMGMTAATQVGPTSQRLDTVRGIITRGKPYSFRNRAVEAYLTTDWPRVN
ncbi:AAA ATPase domain-containing protein [Plantibacter sp. VKM Ac-1784]|uniref:AAA ATPase domain-containing protein n=1 Tax=Plantibacter elymi (nom. nud.) TaxID=199708 RepID=A0ABY1RBH5_9MICO|nr:ATP-binding protein [Plantibacter sp. VKM Ac-1784]SMQ60876.1 AAA ATPase domain-containing protein [Plantibacter sp. VKM Ac-1784]